MLETPKMAALHRLRLADIAGKLEQLEHLASSGHGEQPQVTNARLRLIAAIARQLRAHLEDQLAAGEREPRLAPGESRSPPAP